MLLAAPRTGAFQWTLVNFDNRDYVPLAEVASFYGLRLGAEAGGPASAPVTLTSPGRLLRGNVGSKEFYINDLKFILSFPLLAAGDGFYLSRNDLTKLIEPVLRPEKLRNLGAIRTIILDPGHGGHDRGARSASGDEADIALDVALRVRELLQRRSTGWRIILTRSDNRFIPLEERVQMALPHRDNGLFISIHFNAGSGIGTGIETYLMAPQLVPSYNGDGAPTLAELQRWPSNARDPENMALATAMHAALLSRLPPLHDRGIKRARFHVLRENPLPSVLIEGGFLSNAQEAALVASPAYREAMAGAIVLAIENFRNATRPALQPLAPDAMDRALRAGNAAEPKVSVPNAAN